MSVVEARDLRKTYRIDALSLEVLRGASLVINPGDFIALLGPSGSGKSTLLYILGLMETQTSGMLLFDGTEVRSMTKNQMADIRRREIGFIFQTFNLLPTFSALKNVELPMRLTGASATQRRARARELLEEVGLGDRVQHHPQQLSGGERQRVAIARALANNPKLILADEPTGNLDSETTHSVMKILAQANQQGRTVLVVTHNQEVASYARRILRMRDGEVL